ncbi:MAG: HAD-IIIA family hydrolase [Candidatus Riflebacteria bacterium]|nr:HAD-IIIA family hydrolase [Candidatus Riflebacteria bacterium]
MVPEKRRSLILPAHNSEKVLCVGFFDADSTLREAHSKKSSPHGKHDVMIYRHAAEKLRALSEAGWLLAIVSNQAGISLGYITKAEVEEAMQETIREFAALGAIFGYYDYAENYDENRKPANEMAWRLERKLHQVKRKINWKDSFMVGDAAWKKGHDLQPDGSPGDDHADSDRRFAENIALRHPGFGFFHPRDFFGKQSV